MDGTRDLESSGNLRNDSKMPLCVNSDFLYDLVEKRWNFLQVFGENRTINLGPENLCVSLYVYITQ